MPASYACSVIFFGNRCLYFCCGLLFLSLLGLLSINQAAEQKKKNNNKQTNKPKTKKETHQELVFQRVFFFFFKVFTECAFYARGANPTNKTTSVNTASFNSFFWKNNYSNNMFPFCQPKRAASIKNKNSLVSLREEISTSTIYQLSNGCRNNTTRLLVENFWVSCDLLKLRKYAKTKVGNQMVFFL